MTTELINCAKDSAISFLDDELSSLDDAKVSIGGLEFSAKTVANSSISSLLNKGPRGLAKSIDTHLGEFASQTQNFANKISSETQQSLQNIISGFNLPPINILDNSVESTFRTILAGLSGSSSAVFNLAKNSSKDIANKANQRLAITSQIISIINEIRDVRSFIQTPIFAKTPEDAADSAATNIDSARDFLTIVLSGFESTQDPTLQAGIPRREASYNKALELMSDAMDDLKIGNGQFKLAEYLKLRLDFKLLILQFSEIDIQLQTSLSNFVNAEDEFEENKKNIAAIEGNYVREVFNRLGNLLEDIEAVINRENEPLLLESFEEWSSELLSIYTLAHSAFDKDIEEAVSDANNPDKISYGSSRTVYNTLQPQVDALSIVNDMNFLVELYFNVLRSSTFTEDDVKEREDEILDNLAVLSQLDQQLVEENNNFNPTASDIISILVTATSNSGLDKLSNAIQLGSVSGMFGLLTERLGSKAAEVAGCLKDGLSVVDDLEAREVLLRANSRIQALQRRSQIAGSARENLPNNALRSINKEIENINRLKNEINSIEV